MNPRVFISYAHEDEAIVRQIYLWVKEINCLPWIDSVNLLPGQEWDIEIQNAIEKSDYFIACLSKNSVSKKGYFQKELRKGIDTLKLFPEGSIYLVPLRLDDCPIPISISHIHCVDWFSVGSKAKIAHALGRTAIKSEVADYRTRSIHILTSARGGVGKTLCAKSAAESLYPVLAMDLNFMNPDLSRLRTADQDQLGNRSESSGNTYTFLDGTNDIVQRSSMPYLLPKGSDDFWLQIAKVISDHPETTNVVIDTSLHPFNLFSQSNGEADIQRTISALAHLGASKLYLWFFWTWSAMQDEVFLHFLRKIETSGDLFQLIHVLSPSNFVLPKISLDQFNLSQTLSARQIKSTEIDREIDRVIRKDTNQNALSANRFLEIWNETQKLVSSDINEKLLVQFLTQLTAKKRPYNLFVIPFVPDLRGYTENYSRGDNPPFDRVRWAITSYLKSLPQ